jgi:hypothetical protein
MKYKIFTFFLLILSSLSTYSFSSFTNLSLLIAIPGLLFGVALTLPYIIHDMKGHYREIKIVFIYPCVWIISALLYMGMQIMTSSLSDKIPYVLIGMVSGIVVGIVYNLQFGFRNKIAGIVTVAGLSICAILLFDQLFPMPNAKELNIGKQIAIWQIVVGLGILIHKKEVVNKNPQA